MIAPPRVECGAMSGNALATPRDPCSGHEAPHLALYGNVQIPRAHCPPCGGTSLVVGGRFQCCGEQPQNNPVRQTKRMSGPVQRRRRPSAEKRRQMLEEFDYRCAYCERSFGSYVAIDGKSHCLVIHWDHAVPYAYSQDNRTENFLPACQLCNRWKGALCFQTIDEVRLYVAQKWEQRETLPELRRPVSPVPTEGSEVLQRAMPLEVLGGSPPDSPVRVPPLRKADTGDHHRRKRLRRRPVRKMSVRCHCGVSFSVTWHRQRFCSPRCRRAALISKRGKHNLKLPAWYGRGQMIDRHAHV